MGFELVKVVVGPNPGDHGGWSKHFFFATNPSVSRDEGLMAFWELHDDRIGDTFPVNLNSAIGLPSWVNHIAFDAASLEDLHEHHDRWRRHGLTVAEVDHGFCVSIYTTDPQPQHGRVLPHDSTVHRRRADSGRWRCCSTRPRPTTVTARR